MVSAALNFVAQSQVPYIFVCVALCNLHSACSSGLYQARLDRLSQCFDMQINAPLVLFYKIQKIFIWSHWRITCFSCIPLPQVLCFPWWTISLCVRRWSEICSWTCLCSPTQQYCCVWIKSWGTSVCCSCGATPAASTWRRGRIPRVDEQRGKLKRSWLSTPQTDTAMDSRKWHAFIYRVRIRMCVCEQFFFCVCVCHFVTGALVFIGSE